MEIIHKVEGGLLRIDVELEGENIKKIMISGDFFFFPEEKLEELERELVGKSIRDVKRIVEDFYRNNKIEASITPEDISNALKKISH